MRRNELRCGDLGRKYPTLFRVGCGVGLGTRAFQHVLDQPAHGEVPCFFLFPGNQLNMIRKKGAYDLFC